MCSSGGTQTIHKVSAASTVKNCHGYDQNWYGERIGVVDGEGGTVKDASSGMRGLGVIKESFQKVS